MPAVALFVLQPADQFAQILGRQRRLADDELRAVADQRHRLEIVQHVILQRIDRAIEHMRAPVPDGERISVRRGPRGAQPGDGAGRAGDVFDHHRLPQRPPHMLGEIRASTSVGPPAANGTISVMDRDGKVCARAAAGHTAAAPTAALMKSRRFIGTPRKFFWSLAIVSGSCEHNEGLVPRTQRSA